MMLYSTLQSYATGMGIGFASSIPLGPIGVLCIQRTLNKGRMSGFISGSGAAASDLFYAIVACFSISLVTNFIEQYQNILLVLGAIVLVGFGLKMFLSDPIRQMRSRRKPEKRGKSLWQDFISTLLLTLPNPLALFVFLTAFSFIGGECSLSDQIGIIMGVLTGALLWWLTLTTVVGLFRNKFTMRRLIYLNRIAGLAIVILVVIAAAIRVYTLLKG